MNIVNLNVLFILREIDLCRFLLVEELEQPQGEEEEEAPKAPQAQGGHGYLHGCLK